MKRKKSPVVMTQRRGGRYEAVGFLVILVGVCLCFGGGRWPEAGALTIFAGFVVFLVGRFM